MLRQTVYLVACTKTKARGPCAAKDLYTSPWFRKARRYVEARPGRWFILSAEHGLLDPERVIAPYETTLKRMDRSQRVAWAQRVHRQLLVRRLLPGFLAKIVILAGLDYREHLEHWLTLGGRDQRGVEVPLRGLGLGRQLAWLTQNAPAGPPEPPAPPTPALSQAVNWNEVPDERPPLFEENEAYIAYLRARLPLRLRRRWGRDAGSDPALAGLDTPLFRPLLAS